MAALATMLVRYRRFRHILIFEHRAWPDRLSFALGLGIPLVGGRRGAAAPRLQRRRPDARGRVPGRPDRRPVRRRDGRRAGRPAAALRGRVHRAALRHRLRLRRRRPARALPEGSHLALLAVRLHRRSTRRAWQMLRTLRVDWQVVLLLGADRPRAAAPGARARALGEHQRLFVLPPTSPSLDARVVLLATVLGVATPIKIWNNARIEHRLQEQEKLLLAAKIDALANQINPHFLFNTLTSISSLIRTQPETARMLITKLSGLLRRLMRSTDHFVTLREELESIDEYLDIEVVRFGPQLKVRQAHQPRHARRHRAEHDPAAARRELDQARAGAQDRRRAHHDQHRPAGRPHDHRGARRRARDDGRAARARVRRRHRPEQRQRAAAHDLRRQAASCSSRAFPDRARGPASRFRSWPFRNASQPNMDLRAVLVDDEQLARDELGYLLGQHRRRRGHRAGRQRRRGARDRSTACSPMSCSSTSRCPG